MMILLFLLPKLSGTDTIDSNRRMTSLSLLLQVVVKVSFKDEFSERLLANEAHFNEKLMSSVPLRHGRRWAQFLGECPIPPSKKFPEGVSNLRALVFRRERGEFQVSVFVHDRKGMSCIARARPLRVLIEVFLAVKTERETSSLVLNTDARAKYF